MALREKVFLSRDNAIELGLLIDGVPYDASTTTRQVVKLVDGDGNTVTIDSNTDPSVFDTSQTRQVSDAVSTNILVIKMQDASSPPAARDDYTCTLVLYDATNTDGINWDSPFPVEVVAA